MIAECKELMDCVLPSNQKERYLIALYIQEIIKANKVDFFSIHFVDNVGSFDPNHSLEIKENWYTYIVPKLMQLFDTPNDITLGQLILVVRESPPMPQNYAGGLEQWKDVWEYATMYAMQVAGVFDYYKIDATVYFKNFVPQ